MGKNLLRAHNPRTLLIYSSLVKATSGSSKSGGADFEGGLKALQMAAVLVAEVS